MRAVPVALKHYDRSWLGADLRRGRDARRRRDPGGHGLHLHLPDADRDRPLHDHLPDDPLRPHRLEPAARRGRRLGDRRVARGRARRPRCRRAHAGLGGVGRVVLPHRTRRPPRLLPLARLLRLGFLGDFLSASVLIGFLTGVGRPGPHRTAARACSASPRASGNWLEQQWYVLTNLGSADPVDPRASPSGRSRSSWASAGGPRRCPGALVAVLSFIVVSQPCTDAAAHGVAVVGDVAGRLPPGRASAGTSRSPTPGRCSPIASRA